MFSSKRTLIFSLGKEVMGCCGVGAINLLGLTLEAA
jgi:hypothetical protein